MKGHQVSDDDLCHSKQATTADTLMRRLISTMKLFATADTIEPARKKVRVM